MNNISSIKDCYGCGVCALSCPKHIITIHLNKEGFYEPKLTSNIECIKCRICLNVCAFNDPQILKADPDFKIKSYAAWSNNLITRNTCSSGGIGYELEKKAIDSDYNVCAVKYNLETERAEHYITKSQQELEKSRGSKYIQSYTIPGFSKLNKKQKFLVIGTPCQIDSLRRYLKQFNCENNYVLVDFYCHGVPSMLLWKKYIQSYVPTNIRLTEVLWRNKKDGWHDSWAMTLNGESYSHYSKLSDGDLFYKYFLENRCLNRPCYNQCKYKKENSSADIRIGDLWGNTYQDDEKGVSAVLALSLAGNSWLDSLKNISLLPTPLQKVQEGQMHVCPPFQHKRYVTNLLMLRTTINLRNIDRINRLIDLCEFYISKITNTLNKWKQKK